MWCARRSLACGERTVRRRHGVEFVRARARVACELAERCTERARHTGSTHDSAPAQRARRLTDTRSVTGVSHTPFCATMKTTRGKDRMNELNIVMLYSYKLPQRGPKTHRENEINEEKIECRVVQALSVVCGERRESRWVDEAAHCKGCQGGHTRASAHTALSPSAQSASHSCARNVLRVGYQPVPAAPLSRVSGKLACALAPPSSPNKHELIVAECI